MSKLSNSPNIGKKLEMMLDEVGIKTIEELTEVGSKKAFERVRKLDPSACINMLYALEGAVQNIRHNLLNEEVKNDLKKFIKNL